MHSKTNRKRLIRWLFDGMAVILVVYLIHIWQTWDSARGEAPSLVGETLAGEGFDLSKQPGGPFLIHFWATWCPICRFEADTINRLMDEYPVMTVAMKSGKRDEIQHYLAENSLHFPVIVDPEGQLAAGWGVNAVPTTFIVDEDREIKFVEVGYTTALGLRLRMWWAD